MVESYKKFIESCRYVPIVLWAIPSDEFLHPCATDVSVVFIKQTTNNETYCVSFNHPDLTPVVDKKTFIDDLNKLREKKWVFDKKSFLQILPVENLLDFNLWKHLKTGEVIDEELLETNAHRFIYRSKRDCGDLNKVVPLLKHKEVFEKICDVYFKTDTNILDSIFEKENEIVIETLAELESNGIYVNRDKFLDVFGKEQGINIGINNNIVYTQYKPYHLSGRPSNTFNGINYMALKKNDGTRSFIESRYGKNDGKLVLLDYKSYHPHLLSDIVDYKFEISDAYLFLATKYFNKSYEQITKDDINLSKQLTFEMLYGGVKSEFLYIEFFRRFENYSDCLFQEFNVCGCVETPIFHRKLKKMLLPDMTKNKLVNYILQSYETERNMIIINNINKILRDKKTKIILYQYDSILLDFHKDDINIISDIKHIMEYEKYPLSICIGDNFHDMIKL
jgi:hypothetical protein